MTLTIEISSEREAQLRSYAASCQMTIEEVVPQATEQLVPEESVADLQRRNPKEWAQRFHEWAESHDRTPPVLSDEAMSRESIYPDRA